MADKLFLKGAIPTNQTSAAAGYELEMFELFGDHDADLKLVECQIPDIQPDEEALASGMWQDYSSIFPALNEQGRALARRNEWQFVLENGEE